MVEAGVRPIVVGVDGSTAATHAVSWAAQEAARRDLPLVIVHACALVPVGVPYAEALVPAYHRAQLEYGREWLAAAEPAARDAAPDARGLGWAVIDREQHALVGKWLAPARAEYPDVAVELVVAWHRPARALLEQAENAQLDVVGSRGRGGFRGLLPGSASHALIYHAACPVAVVPPPRP